jgi:hypothetical protein
MSFRVLGNADAKRVIGLMRSLSVPTPWDLAEFLDQVALGRNRPIRLLPYPGLSALGQPCGMWIGRDTDDILVFDTTTSGYHTEQIILHELGHVLLEHGCQRPARPVLATIRQLVPDVEPGTVSRVLARSAFDDATESEAELFASLIMSEQRKVSRDSPMADTFLAD